MTKPEHGNFLELFQQFQAEQSETEWLDSLQQRGIDRFTDLGFPNHRNEEWRFTNINPLKSAVFRAAAPGTIDDIESELQRVRFHKWPGHRLVFVDGRFARNLSATESLPAGVVVGGLADVMNSDGALVREYLAQNAGLNGNPFTALNTAFIRDGGFVMIPDGTVLESPINLIFMTTAQEPTSAVHPRNLIVVGRQSEATIIESYAGPNDTTYFTNAVTAITMDDGAVVDHYKVQRESMAAFHIAELNIRTVDNCRFATHSVSIGGRITRNTINAVLDGEGIDCTLNGLYLGTDNQVIDNHTFIDHAKPHCNSYEIYKGILDKKAAGVFNGKIYVRPSAQKTDALQTNRALLLSDDATINTKPELEIYADDVKCTHGATIGQLDADALFYLRSRGIDEATAKGILTYAFACEAVTDVKVDAIHKEVEAILMSRFREA